MSIETRNQIKDDIKDKIGEDEEEPSLSEVKRYLKTKPELLDYFEDKGENCILVKLYKKYEMIELNMLVVWVYSVNQIIKLQKFFRECFPDFSILEKLNLFVRVKLSSNYKLSQIFGELYKNQQNLNIDEYNVKQMSLEQIFLTFANQNKE